jgi:histidinol-phosphate aminotransferase
MSYFPSRIEKMSGYVPGEQPTEPDVIKLNTNENPYPPSPRVMETLRRASGEQLRRYPHPMGQAFREAAAKVLGVTPDMILCGNGADDVLNIAIRALTDGEHGMAWPGPTYTLCAVLAELHGCQVREVPFGPDYSLPLDELARAAASLTYVCNPNSPTATFVEPSDLADLAKRLRGVLLIDEAYVDFAAQNCLPLAAELPNVLVVRTLSKGYSLAGLRFGYAVGSPELIAGLAKAKDSYNVDALSIAAATAAIQDQAYFRQNVERVCCERERLSGALTKLGIAPLPSQANFLFARCQSPPAGRIYQALKDRNILVRHFDQSGLSDWLRITVGTPDQNDALLNELASIMQSASQSKGAEDGQT